MVVIVASAVEEPDIGVEVVLVEGDVVVSRDDEFELGVGGFEHVEGCDVFVA